MATRIWFGGNDIVVSADVDEVKQAVQEGEPRSLLEFERDDEDDKVQVNPAAVSYIEKA